ncbi:MAG: branched-chain amino acid ABC transporter permease [Chloroflexota bacterium]|nr:MAG: branched-chain amino acid ABC transporter permease [Chloroflexota bacterium]
MDEIFFQQIINGIALGSSYALVAVGFSLMFGILRAANLAHGEVAMVGTFVCLTAARLGLPFPAALATGAIAAGVASLAIERICFLPYRKHDYVIPVLSTIGMSIFLQSIAIQLWGSDATLYKVGFPSVRYEIGPIGFTSVHIMIVVTTVVLMFALTYLVYRTKVGRGIRAIAENVEIARAIGIKPGPLIVLVFIISGPIAGIAGILVGLNNTAVSPFFGLEMTFKGMVAMFLGGMTNMYGAVLAGLLIGLVEVLMVGYFSANYRDGVVYALFILALLIRPQGLLGTVATRRV